MRQRLRTRPIGLLLAVLMLLSLLSGCSAWELPFTTDGGELPQRMNYQGSAPVDMVPFSKMEYARPDGDAIGSAADEQLREF